MPNLRNRKTADDSLIRIQPDPASLLQIGVFGRDRHQSVTITERHYAHLSPDVMAAAVQVLNDFLPKALPSSEKKGKKSIAAVAVSLLESKCRGGESNPYDPCGSQDFKSCASASSATPALFAFSRLQQFQPDASKKSQLGAVGLEIGPGREGFLRSYFRGREGGIETGLG